MVKRYNTRFKTKRQHGGFLKLDLIALNAWLVVCCLSLEVYYVGMSYLYFSKKVSLYSPRDIY